jgi:hypothetical protein
LTGWSARDEVDGDVSDTLRFSSMNFENKDKQYWLFGATQQFHALQTKAQTFNVVASARDHAGEFGTGGQDNVNHVKVLYTVSDTTPPTVVDADFHSQTAECCAYNHNRNPNKYNRKYRAGHEWAACTYDHGSPVAMDHVSGPVPLSAVKVDGIKIAADDSTSDDAVLKTVGDHTIKYTAKDHSKNYVSVIRTVKVVDTTPPLILLTASKQITIHRDSHSANSLMSEQDVKAWDDCSDMTGATISYQLEGPTSETDSTPVAYGNDKKLNVTGDYEITYTVADNAGLTATIKRTIHVVNKISPIIYLKGESHSGYTVTTDVLNKEDCARLGKTSLKVEDSPDMSTTDNIYLDYGATCKDYTGQPLYVRTIADNIDRCNVGEYDIIYTCKDAANNEARQLKRKVIVVDREPPTCEMALAGGKRLSDSCHHVDQKNCEKEQYLEQWTNPNRRNRDLKLRRKQEYKKIDIVVNSVEAGFPFKDPSCAPSDNYKPELATVSVSNNIVAESASKAWNMASCMAIKAEYSDLPADQRPKDGWYFITTPRAQGDQHLDQKTRVYCVGMDTTKPVTHKQCVGACADYCSKIGLVMTTGASVPPGHDANAPYCTVTAAADAIPDGYTASHEAIIDGSRMKSGTYVFQYFVTDSEGNTNDCWDHKPTHDTYLRNCQQWKSEAYIRIVKVTDTLAPVITLHDRANPNHVLFPTQFAAKVGGWTGKYRGNPFLQGGLMAEQGSHVNGWALAAAACAVAGLALVGYSSKRTTNFVPV